MQACVPKSFLFYLFIAQRKVFSSNSLFMCQDKDEDENQSFGSFWNLCMTNKPILQCIIVLRAWFVRHRLYPERTKSFVFGSVFVFVLAHEQPIITLQCCPSHVCKGYLWPTYE